MISRGRQLTVSIQPRAGESVGDIFTRLARSMNDSDATLAHLLVFGSVSARPPAMQAMRRSFGDVDWPITWIEGAACDGRPIAGIQALAVSGTVVGRVTLAGHTLGSVFEQTGTRHCILGGLGPWDRALSGGDQTAQTLEVLQTALAQAGFSLADVIRTWFFLNEILAWYDEFNRARTAVYSGVKFRSRSLPASTGVGARNPGRAALAVAAWAVKPLNPSVRIEEVASPLQCPAPCYGSSFSRAVEISAGTKRQLLISGTASIAPGGKTAWRDDPRKQIELTMEVVENILHSRGFSLAEVNRATAYFKHRKDAGLFDEWRASRGLESFPAVVAKCDICRDDLLFELEADAWK